MNLLASNNMQSLGSRRALFPQRKCAISRVGLKTSTRRGPLYTTRSNLQDSQHSNSQNAATPVEVAQIAEATKAATPTTPTSDDVSLEALFTQAKATGKRLYDKVYYGDVLPPTGSFQLSYARLLELLHKRKVKRIMLLSDGRTCIVEIPVENTESDFTSVTYDRRDYNIQYADEVPEWKMEKNRYYCELPGDVWEEGTFMQLIKSNQERWVYVNGQWRIPYDNLLRLNEVRPELQVVDPGDAYVWLNQYSTQFLPIAGLLTLRLVIGAGDFLLRKLGKQKKSAEEELAEELGKHRAKEYNVEDSTGKTKGSKKDTGVRYSDVAGIDAVKNEIREVLDILLGDEKYLSMGAHPVRGVLLEGPPGTGKTLLAKAMAGEAGVPFFSANGAEFVEMFQGVAAARIRSLFQAARKNAPSIIFIDEIDAIAKARDSGPSDSGTQEREQGLLQLLTEMDGFFQGDAVLVVAATNRASALDEALLRPGRFDRTIHMGRPSPANRLRILQVHAKDKPIDRSNDDALLKQVAELTIGYSGAELANLLNEGAILAVRKDVPQIDLSILKEAMDKVKLGLPHASLPDTPAKRRFAAVEAARAVAFALTPGLPPIEHVTIRPRGGAQARILFVPQESRRDGGTWNLLVQPGTTVNAVEIKERMTPLQLLCGLLTPLYVARCCEEELFGADGASLLTSKEISKAGELARWIVVDSQLHPATNGTAVKNNMIMGGGKDPTTGWMDTSHEEAILALQKGAYNRARKLVQQRRPVIETIANELCENPDELVLGSRIIQLLHDTPLAEIAHTDDTSVDSEGVAAVKEALGDEMLSSDDLRSLVEVVLGRVEDFDLVPGSVARQKAAAVKEQLLNKEERKRLESIVKYVRGDGPFPEPPVTLPEDKGISLDNWSAREEDEVIVL